MGGDGPCRAWSEIHGNDRAGHFRGGVRCGNHRKAGNIRTHSVRLDVKPISKFTGISWELQLKLEQGGRTDVFRLPAGDDNLEWHLR